MVERKPTADRTVETDLERAGDQATVGDQILMREHDAFGSSGGSGSVLNQPQIIGRYFWLDPIIGQLAGNVFGCDPGNFLQTG